MKKSRRIGRILIALAAACSAAQAQLNAPHAAYAFPAGGRRGEAVAVKIGGQFLANVDKVYVSGGGVEVKIGEYIRPIRGVEAQQMREKVQELQKKPPSPALLQEINDLRRELFLFNANRTASPVLAETLPLKISISEGAEPGKRELRLGSPQGISNPIAFYVGALPEVTEPEAVENKTGPKGALLGIFQPPTDMAVSLPVVINGRIKPRLEQPPAGGFQASPFAPGDADRYRFRARRGEHLVAAAGAREIVPYLADAVPGWFQATLALIDAKGRELAYADGYRFHPDPVLHCEIPADGEYILEIKDALFRGREDFVYRLSVGELPFITGVFPLGGRDGRKTEFRLSGWNLPAVLLKMDPGEHGPGIHSLTVKKGDVVSNAVPIEAGDLPEITEPERGDGASAARRIGWPVIVNGRIDKPGDIDVYQFDGRAGQPIVAEVRARRLESPLDSSLTLADAAGKTIAFNDDFEDKGAGLETHHADSYILAVLPEDGTYTLTLRDVQQKGGPEFAYRLRVSAPRPDFELRVAPSSVTVPNGMTVPLSVCALRHDGFSGDIRLGLKDAPSGFRLDGGLVPAGQSAVTVTLTAFRTLLAGPVDLHFEGRALIGGREVKRIAEPAEDMMQAFAYRHLVPSLEFKAAMRRGAAFGAPVEVDGKLPLEIRAGEPARLRFKFRRPARSPLDKFQFELSEPPEGVELAGQTIDRDGAEIILKCDPAKAKTGRRGNLIVNVSAERTPPPAAKANGAGGRQRIPLGTMPAVPYEIVGR